MSSRKPGTQEVSFSSEFWGAALTLLDQGKGSPPTAGRRLPHQMAKSWKMRGLAGESQPLPASISSEPASQAPSSSQATAPPAVWTPGSHTPRAEVFEGPAAQPGSEAASSSLEGH